MEASAAGVPLKLNFGSDFPYRKAESVLGLDAMRIGLKASLATGGFSSVWGGAILPFSKADLEGWPITQGDLAPHYREALALTGFAAVRDDLEALYPLFSEECASLAPSRQAASFLDGLERNRDELVQNGFIFGRSRLAVRDCQYCGLCMYGCPYGFIYQSSQTVASYRDNPRVRHVRGVAVDDLIENEDGVEARGRNIADGSPLSIKAKRVFLAAGPISSARILLRSLKRYDSPVSILDSQYFLFPLLMKRRTRSVEKDALYTLSQLFLEVIDPEISPHTVHLQIYSYNDLIDGALRKSMGPLARFSAPIRDRMLIVQGYLHSDHSPSIEAVLRAEDGKLRLRPKENPQTASIIRKILRKLWDQRKYLEAIPLGPLLQITEPGRGFHSGASFPMSKTPTDGETDLLGRPSGFTRLHVVDSSVFPTMPATTIILSAMANARRIARGTPFE